MPLAIICHGRRAVAAERTEHRLGQPHARTRESTEASITAVDGVSVGFSILPSTGRGNFEYSPMHDVFGVVLLVCRQSSQLDGHDVKARILATALSFTALISATPSTVFAQDALLVAPTATDFVRTRAESILATINLAAAI